MSAILCQICPENIMTIDVITVTINNLILWNVHNAIKILLKVLQINDMYCNGLHTLSRVRVPPMLAKVCGIKKAQLQCWLSRGHQVLSPRGESEESVVCRHWNVKARYPLWLWNPGQTSSGGQNRNNSGSTKMTYVLPIFPKIFLFLNHAKRCKGDGVIGNVQLG